MRAFLALGVIVFSSAAAAQSGQNLVVGADNGFFRPAPNNDPSLTHPPPAPQVPQPFLQVPAQAQVLALPQAPAMPQVITQVQPPQVQYQQVPLAQPVPQPVPVVVPVQVTTPPPAVAKAEQALDHAEAEAQVAQQKAKQQPAQINGAFTGLTDERNR